MFENCQTDPKPAQILSTRPSQYLPAQSNSKPPNLATLQTTSSVSHMFIYLWRAAEISTTRCHQLQRRSHTSVTLAQYLATFRTFWWLFFHNRDILTNQATFLKKPIIQLEDVSSTALRALVPTPGAVSPLSASVLTSERQSFQLSVTQPTHP